MRDSREASLATNFDSRVSRESREYFGPKSETRFLQEFQKVILVSTLARILRQFVFRPFG